LSFDSPPIDAGKLAALDLAMARQETATEIERVGRLTNPEAARWAFEQKSLRKRAQKRFERAAEMVFTPQGLEQASAEGIARYRASRFPARVPVTDLTCGIGADLIALASRGETTGVDLNPESLACARWNLAVYGLEAQLECRDALGGVRSDYAIADPSRRIGRSRTLDPNEFSPNPEALVSLLGQLKLGCLKLSPMLPDSWLESLGPCLEFWSLGGECREASIWMGSESGIGRWAVHVESGMKLASDDPPPATEQCDAWFYEADPAAIRAHALGTLCEEFGLEAYLDSNGYLTGPNGIDSPWLKRFRVLEELPGQTSRTKSALRRLGGGEPIIKSRAQGIDVRSLQAVLTQKGDRTLVVAVAALGPKLRHVILEPVT
jgi:hypothetical protein